MARTVDVWLPDNIVLSVSLVFVYLKLLPHDTM